MSEETAKNKEKETAPKKGLNQDLLLEALHYQQHNMRLGCAKVKSRAEVSGGGAKPWRQKGTGRARQGSTRAVQWSGGGRAFGSEQRVYDMKMNKKARAAALLSLLLAKKAEGRLLILDGLAYEAPSTKQFVAMLKEKEVAGKAVFLYGAGADKNVVRSASNLRTVKLLHFDKINIKALLNSDWLLVCAADADKLRLPEGLGE